VNSFLKNRIIIFFLALLMTLTGCEKVAVNEKPKDILDSNGSMIKGADPKVMLAADGKYYMYTTEDNGELPTWRSEDLETWENIDTALSNEAYLDTGNESDKVNNRLWLNWAPYVFRLGDDYVMFISSYAAPEAPEFGYHLKQSIYASRSKSPTGPFERFVSIQPRVKDIHAPHSSPVTLKSESEQTPDPDIHATMRIDAYVFHDTKTKKDYMSYVSYGNPEDPLETGNHIQLFWLKNAQFEEGNGKEPGLYYDYDPQEKFYISNPQKWPEVQVPMSLDSTDNPWRPAGKEYGWPDIPYERFITEAPVLAYIKGWYHFYFSVNTWDSPSYQIVEVKAKNLRDLDIHNRPNKSNIQYSIFQEPNKSAEAWANFGSGSAIRDKKGQWWYMMHSLPKGGTRFVMKKPITD
jgi:beta-xylosidase